MDRRRDPSFGSLLSSNHILLRPEIWHESITTKQCVNLDINSQTPELIRHAAFAVITAVYGMISFAHYAFRSLKLFRTKTAQRWRPSGWTKWGFVSSSFPGRAVLN